MKRRLCIAVWCLLLTLLLSACGETGDTISGYSTVAVSLKTPETTAPPAALDYTDMAVIFDAVLCVMENEGCGYLPNDSTFCWRVLSAVFSRLGASGAGVEHINGISYVSPQRIVEYASAFLYLTPENAVLPPLGAGCVYGEQSDIYALPCPDYPDSEVRINDVLEEGNGEYTAYVDWIVGDAIANRYIITLVRNPYPQPQDGPAFAYTITAAGTMEKN